MGYVIKIWIAGTWHDVNWCGKYSINETIADLEKHLPVQLWDKGKLVELRNMASFKGDCMISG